MQHTHTHTRARAINVCTHVHFYYKYLNDLDFLLLKYQKLTKVKQYFYDESMSKAI